MAKAKKRSDGRLRTSFLHDGKRVYVYGRTKQELAENEIKKRQQLAEGKEHHDNPTMNEYYERFTDQRRASIKEATLRSQRNLYNLCKNVVIPGVNIPFGDVRIRDVTTADVKHIQSTFIQEGRHSRTINLAMSHLHHVFNVAIKSELIEKDPTRVITAVKRTEPAARDTIHRALTDEEIKAFFDAAKGNYYYNHMLLMLLTGIRAGEMAALLPGDIDFQQKVMHIARTITSDEVGGAKMGDSTKTAAGVRNIPLTDQAIDCIRDQMRQNKLISFGDARQPIFRSVEGHYATAVILNLTIEKICKAAAIERFSCHCFRHTFATIFIKQQPEEFKTLSSILGHSNVSITLNLYAHSMMETKKKAMENLKIAL